MLSCQHPSMISLRVAAKDRIQEAAAQHNQREQTFHIFVARVIEFILDKSFDAQYSAVDRLWLGTWNESLLHDAFMYMSNPDDIFPESLTHEEIIKIQKAIVAVTEPLTDTLKCMMHARRFQQPAAAETSQPDPIYQT